MSFKDLYSEVKKRKMAALGKQKIVKAVEQHGKILGIKGKYEKPDKVIKYTYANVKEVIHPNDVPKTNLSLYDVVLVGCPGSEIPKSGISKFREYVHAFFAREFLGFIQELADSEISEKEKKRRIKKKLEKLKETEDFKNLYEFLRRLRRIAEDFNYYPSARLSGCVHLINLDAINKIDEMVSHILMEGE